jgi:MFS family permease
VVLVSVIYGVVMLAFAFSTNFQLSLMCSFLMGVGAMYWVNNMNTLMQTSVPEKMRGRVMGIFRITKQSMPLGWLLGGVLATLLGNVPTLSLCALLFIGFNLLAYLRSSQLPCD